MNLALIGSPTVAFVVAALLTRRFCDPKSRLHVLDHPNERSLHSRPTPRTGGVAILGGLALAIPAWLVSVDIPKAIIWAIVSATLVGVLSFVDDRRRLHVGVRLAGHILAAALVIMIGWSGSVLVLPGLAWAGVSWTGAAVGVFFLVWMTNLYNFMDGMDGFAGGMTVIGFGSFAVLGWRAGDPAFAVMAITIAAAAGGFLLFNFPPARIFMGDTGSATLGFLAGVLSLWGAHQGVFPFWVAILTFSPFIVDATVTLLRRLLRGERVWQAHKTHYYQRLVQLGWGHGKTVLWGYVLMLACSLSALWAVSLGPTGQLILMWVWCGLYLGLMMAVPYLERAKAGV